ncbi:MAG: hypothetical protein ACXIVQ_02060 [Acidimicrobiales bacterium]
MWITIGVLVVSALLAAVLWRALEPVFAQDTLQRTNVHGRPVPTAGGVVIVLVTVLVVAVVEAETALGPGWTDETREALLGVTLVVVLGFGLLGMVDDLLGGADARGFRGHLGALAHGRLTTGGLKLLGGGVVAVLAAVVVRGGPGTGASTSVAGVARDALLIALAANLANLLDRAPGRVTKVALPVGAVLVLVSPSTLEVAGDGSVLSAPVVGVAIVVGAAVGLLVFELRERLMLGDTGANALGAALGLGAVQVLGPTARTVTVVVLLGLNVASEVVSFSRLIAATPGLRDVDRWGRARE